MPLLPGRATPAGTAAYAAAHPAPHGHYRSIGGLQVSSLGLGSYLGQTTPQARQDYEEAALLALQSGVNVLDTASNYREQLSERDLGRALRRFVESGGARDQIVVSTKAGFLHGDADSDLGSDWFQAEYVLDGTVTRADVVDTIHCMTPAYLERELARSRANLGVETIDVWFLHNPETQLAAGVDRDEFLARVRAAFEWAERQCDAGTIKVYGVATWDGLRVPPHHPASLRLVELVHEAGQARMAVGGTAAEHHFRAVQFPLNLAMPEAALDATQPWRFGDTTTLEAARDLGMLVYTSASLMQTRLRGRVPPEWKEALGTEDDLETALQFTRSVPGVHTALVGMGRPEHVRQNVAWALARGPDSATVKTMMGTGGPHG